MRRLAWGAGLALAVTGLVAGGAGTAFAFPSKTTACNQCHGGPNVAVSTSAVSNNGTTATYGVNASGADAIAVFSGATKVASITGASGQFSVATGATYAIYAVAGPGTSDGLGVASVSPAKPVADTTAPTTTSDAKSTYVGSASIKLTATDGTGSGVAATYYRLDGGAQTAGTVVGIAGVGSHTLEFWSVDVAGNVEAHKTVSFTVTSADLTAPITSSDVKASYVGSASVKLTAVDNAGGSGVAATYYRLDGGAQTAGTTIAVGTVGSHTIEFWSVDVAGNAETPHKTATFTIAAADVTAPITTSDAVPSYVSSAAIKLTAVDNAGGSGVAATYYRLDGGAQTAGTSVTAGVGSHTLAFWSVDAAGNAEVPSTVSFTVTQAPPTIEPSTVTIRTNRDDLRVRRAAVLGGVLSPARTGDTVGIYVLAPGSTQWTLVKTVAVKPLTDGSGSATWSLRYRSGSAGAYQVQARFAGDATREASVSPTITIVWR